MVAMMVGVLITVMVQSSSITTSILVPLAASGILLVRNAYPITLGANIGTTVTALLAALATGVVGGMTIAIVHLLFNVVGILILYPFPKFRYIPVTLAEKLASIAATRKPLAVVYVVGTFVVLPLLGILIFN
jgi:sodium-dependent phosphate cotransporter